VGMDQSNPFPIGARVTAGTATMAHANAEYVYAAAPDPNYHPHEQRHDLIIQSTPTAVVFAIVIVTFVWIDNRRERRIRVARTR
jgi:hypothetical protein